MSVPVWFPTCAVCSKPVERMITSKDPFLRVCVFVVECHGAAEETRIGFDQVESDQHFFERMRGGVAFKIPALQGV